MAKNVLVLVGTMKGAFVLRSDRSRKRFTLSDLQLPGCPIYALFCEIRNKKPRLWAGVESWQWGTDLRYSDNLGKNWVAPERPNIRFPEQTKAALKRVWQVAAGPNKLYCGVEPAALFESSDKGATWSLNEGLWNHPHRPQWQPGGGGLCLHTILPDPVNPDIVTVAVSAAGVYQTRDGGKSWQSKNRGLRADFLPENKYPEFGQCVHKVAHHPSIPSRLYLQNHGGLYRSDNYGDQWKDIANGVPSDFGFGLDVHPHDPDTAFIVPLDAEGGRVVPGGKMRIYRTQNAGKSWRPLFKGLPQKKAFETVLRDGLATDSLDPAGVYVGTRSGKLFASSNEGDSWRLVEGGLPAVTCVKAFGLN